ASRYCVAVVSGTTLNFQSTAAGQPLSCLLLSVPSPVEWSAVPFAPKWESKDGDADPVPLPSTLRPTLSGISRQAENPALMARTVWAELVVLHPSGSPPSEPDLVLMPGSR